MRFVDSAFPPSLSSLAADAGKLPARWVVTSFIKFITTLAPQLEANVDGNEPRFLTPAPPTKDEEREEQGSRKSDEDAVNCGRNCIPKRSKNGKSEERFVNCDRNWIPK